MTGNSSRSGQVWKRRDVLRASLLGGATLGLAGCGGNVLGSLGREQPTAAAAPSAATGGSARIGLVLPLSASGQGGVTAVALKNAAELAVAQFNDPGIQLIVKDDKGTADGARAATQEAIGEGAQIILGPLFAPAVVAAGEVAKPAGRPIIAFSTDANAGSKGVYLLSFMVEPEVERIVGYAASQGIRSFAALAPESAYGNVASAAFQQSVAAAGGTIAALERFPDDRTKLEAPIEKIMAVAGANPKAQALFLPADAQVLAAIAPLLGQKGFDPARVRPLGTGVWNDPAAFRLKELQGGWFAAPNSSGFNSFAARYRARYNANPTRIATLSYDAVSLAVALGRSQGARAYADETLTNPSGFSGADGVFRFRATGGNDRGLAVLAVRNGSTQVVSAAPQGFQGA